MVEEEPPAGWYRDGTGRTRWWDGKQWTVPDHLFPGAPAAPSDADTEPVSEPVTTADEAPTRVHAQTWGKQPKATRADKAFRPWYRKKH